MTGNDKQPASPRRPLWRRILRWALWLAASIILLTALALGMIVWIFTPAKLTPLVNRYASEFLDAEVEARRVELTVWSTFPRLQLQVDSLTVVSRSLDRLSASDRAKLPSGADTLLVIPQFSGGINLTSLMLGDIELYDVEFRSPRVNIVAVNDTVSNIDIFPASAPEPERVESQAIDLPGISVNSFRIAGSAPLRYMSLADSIDCSVTLRSTSLVNKGMPIYRIDIQGLAEAMIASALPRTDIEIGLDGDLHWNPATPCNIGLHDFTVAFGPLHISADIDADFTDRPVIETLSAKLNPVRIDSIVAALPEPWRNGISPIGDDLAITASVRLTSPFDMTADSIPSVDAEIEVPDGRLTYEQLRLNRVGLKVSARVNGSCPDSSVIVLDRFTAAGRSTDMTLKATVTSPLTDPRFDGRFNGSIDLSRLPRQLLQQLPLSLSGRIEGNTGFNLRLSDLTPRTFHRALLNGSLTLRDFHASQPDSLDATVHLAELRFGTNNGFVNDTNKVDSLLTVSVKADTASISTPDIKAEISGLKMGAGCRNTASTTDTTVINPIGGTIHITRLNMLSVADSSRIRMRDVACGAALSRFNDQARVPRLAMKATARRLSYGDRTARISLRNSAFDISANLNPHRFSPRVKARYDSIAALHPDLPSDSIIAIMMRSRRGRMQSPANSAAEFIDMTVDNSTARLLAPVECVGHTHRRIGTSLHPIFPAAQPFHRSRLPVQHRQHRLPPHALHRRTERFHPAWNCKQHTTRPHITPSHANTCGTDTVERHHQHQRTYTGGIQRRGIRHTCRFAASVAHGLRRQRRRHAAGDRNPVRRNHRTCACAHERQRKSGHESPPHHLLRPAVSRLPRIAAGRQRRCQPARPIGVDRHRIGIVQRLVLRAYSGRHDVWHGHETQ